MKKKVLLFTLLAALLTINIAAFAADRVKLDFLIMDSQGERVVASATKSTSSIYWEIYHSTQSIFDANGDAIRFVTRDEGSRLVSDYYTFTSFGIFKLPYTIVPPARSYLRLSSQVDSTSASSMLWFVGDWTP